MAGNGDDQQRDHGNVNKMGTEGDQNIDMMKMFMVFLQNMAAQGKVQQQPEV